MQMMGDGERDPPTLPCPPGPMSSKGDVSAWRDQRASDRKCKSQATPSLQPSLGSPLQLLCGSGKLPQLDPCSHLHTPGGFKAFNTPVITCRCLMAP